MTQTKPSFVRVDYPEPHPARTRAILKKYPGVRKLFGPNPWTFLVTVVIVAGQLGAAVLVRNQPWWVMVLLAFVLGAVIEHTLFVVIHEATHNLIFRTPFWNKFAGIVANLSGVVPSAIGFRNFHLLHHHYQGEMGFDADIASPREAALVGNSSIRKTIWFFFFFVVEGIVRPLRIKKINIFESWSLFNGFTSVGAGLLILYYCGWMAFVYLLLSTMLSIGLHPLGGRWIQEHYVFKPGQETYSYYGPLNILSMNVGYHNEHHDFMMVPWSRLPALKRLAPEFYDSLYSHSSLTKVLLRFIFDKNMTLYSRVVRPDHPEKRAQLMTSADTQLITNRAHDLVGYNQPSPQGADGAQIPLHAPTI